MKRTKSIPKMLLSVRRLFNIIITHELWNAIKDYIVFGNRRNYFTISGKSCQKILRHFGLQSPPTKEAQ